MLYYQVATSFVAFLLEAYGPERFKQFAREFDAEAPDHAAEAAYGKPVSHSRRGVVVHLEEVSGSRAREWWGSYGFPLPTCVLTGSRSFS